MPQLRELELRSLDDVVHEIERLRECGCTRRGNWNLSQMCVHLTETMRVGLDGDEPRLAWPLRKLFGLMLRRVLRTRKMPSGAPTVARLRPTQTPTDDPATTDLCLATLAEARDFAGPLPPHPLIDKMTLDEWKDLMVIHAQHHLRFLEPNRIA